MKGPAWCISTGCMPLCVTTRGHLRFLVGCVACLEPQNHAKFGRQGGWVHRGVSTWSSCSLLHAQHGTVLPLCPPLWIGVLSVVRLPHFNHGHGFWPFLAACRWFHRCGLAHWSCFEHNSALHGNLTHHQPSMHGPLLQGVHCTVRYKMFAQSPSCRWRPHILYGQHSVF